MVVQAVDGRSYADFLQQEFFDPLGMADTGFSVAEPDADRITSLYVRLPNKSVHLVDDRAAKRLCREPALQSGGGGLVGSLDDYARFCQMLTAGGRPAVGPIHAGMYPSSAIFA